MKMLLRLIVIVIVGAVSFYFTDIDSKSFFVSRVLLIIDFIVLVALGLWFVFLFQILGVNQITGNSDSYDGTDTYVDW